MEQGSYMLIEHGMTVQGTDGDLGTVAQIVADEGVDIFRGIVIAHGLLLPKQFFIPAENVVSVMGRTVRVNLTKSDAERLPSPTFSTSVTEATQL